MEFIAEYITPEGEKSFSSKFQAHDGIHAVDVACEVKQVKAEDDIIIHTVH